VKFSISSCVSARLSVTSTKRLAASEGFKKDLEKNDNNDRMTRLADDLGRQARGMSEKDLARLAVENPSITRTQELLLQGKNLAAHEQLLRSQAKDPANIDLQLKLAESYVRLNNEAMTTKTLEAVMRQVKGTDRQVEVVTRAVAIAEKSAHNADLNRIQREVSAAERSVRLNPDNMEALKRAEKRLNDAVNDSRIIKGQSVLSEQLKVNVLDRVAQYKRERLAVEKARPEPEVKSAEVVAVKDELEAVLKLQVNLLTSAEAKAQGKGDLAAVADVQKTRRDILFEGVNQYIHLGLANEAVDAGKVFTAYHQTAPDTSADTAERLQVITGALPALKNASMAREEMTKLKKDLDSREEKALKMGKQNQLVAVAERLEKARVQLAELTKDPAADVKKKEKVNAEIIKLGTALTKLEEASSLIIAKSEYQLMKAEIKDFREKINAEELKFNQALDTAFANDRDRNRQISYTFMKNALGHYLDGNTRVLDLGRQLLSANKSTVLYTLMADLAATTGRADFTLNAAAAALNATLQHVGRGDLNLAKTALADAARQMAVVQEKVRASSSESTDNADRLAGDLAYMQKRHEAMTKYVEAEENLQSGNIPQALVSMKEAVELDRTAAALDPENSKSGADHEMVNEYDNAFLYFRLAQMMDTARRNGETVSSAEVKTLLDGYKKAIGTLSKTDPNAKVLAQDINSEINRLEAGNFIADGKFEEAAKSLTAALTENEHFVDLTSDLALLKDKISSDKTLKGIGKDNELFKAMVRLVAAQELSKAQKANPDPKGVKSDLKKRQETAKQLRAAIKAKNTMEDLLTFLTGVETVNKPDAAGALSSSQMTASAVNAPGKAAPAVVLASQGKVGRQDRTLEVHKRMLSDLTVMNVRRDLMTHDFLNKRTLRGLQRTTMGDLSKGLDVFRDPATRVKELALGEKVALKYGTIPVDQRPVKFKEIMDKLPTLRADVEKGGAAKDAALVELTCLMKYIMETPIPKWNTVEGKDAAEMKTNAERLNIQTAAIYRMLESGLSNGGKSWMLDIDVGLGKTEMNAGVAVLLARMGKRVVLGAADAGLFQKFINNKLIKDLAKEGKVVTMEGRDPGKRLTEVEEGKLTIMTVGAVLEHSLDIVREGPEKNIFKDAIFMADEAHKFLLSDPLVTGSMAGMERLILNFSPALKEQMSRELKAINLTLKAAERYVSQPGVDIMKITREKTKHSQDVKGQFVFVGKDDAAIKEAILKELNDSSNNLGDVFTESEMRAMIGEVAFFLRQKVGGQEYFSYTRDQATGKLAYAVKDQFRYEYRDQVVFSDPTGRNFRAKVVIAGHDLYKPGEMASLEEYASQAFSHTTEQITGVEAVALFKTRLYSTGTPQDIEGVVRAQQGEISDYVDPSRRVDLPAIKKGPSYRGVEFLDGSKEESAAEIADHIMQVVSGDIKAVNEQDKQNVINTIIFSCDDAEVRELVEGILALRMKEVKGSPKDARIEVVIGDKAQELLEGIKDEKQVTRRVVLTDVVEGISVDRAKTDDLSHSYLIGATLLSTTSQAQQYARIRSTERMSSRMPGQVKSFVLTGDKNMTTAQRERLANVMDGYKAATAEGIKNRLENLKELQKKMDDKKSSLEYAAVTKMIDILSKLTGDPAASKEFTAAEQQALLELEVGLIQSELSADRFSSGVMNLAQNVSQQHKGVLMDYLREQSTRMRDNVVKEFMQYRGLDELDVMMQDGKGRMSYLADRDINRTVVNILPQQVTAIKDIKFGNFTLYQGELLNYNNGMIVAPSQNTSGDFQPVFSVLTNNGREEAVVDFKNNDALDQELKAGKYGWRKDGAIIEKVTGKRVGQAYFDAYAGRKVQIMSDRVASLMEKNHLIGRNGVVQKNELIQLIGDEAARIVWDHLENNFYGVGPNERTLIKASQDHRMGTLNRDVDWSKFDFKHAKITFNDMQKVREFLQKAGDPVRTQRLIKEMLDTGKQHLEEFIKDSDGNAVPGITITSSIDEKKDEYIDVKVDETSFATILANTKVSQKLKDFCQMVVDVQTLGKVVRYAPSLEAEGSAALAGDVDVKLGSGSMISETTDHELAAAGVLRHELGHAIARYAQAHGIEMQQDAQWRVIAANGDSYAMEEAKENQGEAIFKFAFKLKTGQLDKGKAREQQQAIQSIREITERVNAISTNSVIFLSEMISIFDGFDQLTPKQQGKILQFDKGKEHAYINLKHPAIARWAGFYGNDADRIEIPLPSDYREGDIAPIVAFLKKISVKSLDLNQRLFGISSFVLTSLKQIDDEDGISGPRKAFLQSVLDGMNAAIDQGNKNFMAYVKDSNAFQTPELIERTGIEETAEGLLQTAVKNQAAFKVNGLGQKKGDGLRVITEIMQDAVVTPAGDEIKFMSPSTGRGFILNKDGLLKEFFGNDASKAAVPLLDRLNQLTMSKKFDIGAFKTRLDKEGAPEPIKPSAQKMLEELQAMQNAMPAAPAAAAGAAPLPPPDENDINQQPPAQAPPAVTPVVPVPPAAPGSASQSTNPWNAQDRLAVINGFTPASANLSAAQMSATLPGLSFSLKDLMHDAMLDALALSMEFKNKAVRKLVFDNAREYLKFRGVALAEYLIRTLAGRAPSANELALLASVSPAVLETVRAAEDLDGASLKKVGSCVHAQATSAANNVIKTSSDYWAEGQPWMAYWNAMLGIPKPMIEGDLNNRVSALTGRLKLTKNSRPELWAAFVGVVAFKAPKVDLTGDAKAAAAVLADKFKAGEFKVEDMVAIVATAETQGVTAVKIVTNIIGKEAYAKALELAQKGNMLSAGAFKPFVVTNRSRGYMMETTWNFVQANKSKKTVTEITAALNDLAPRYKFAYKANDKGEYELWFLGSDINKEFEPSAEQVKILELRGKIKKIGERYRASKNGKIKADSAQYVTLEMFNNGANLFQKQIDRIQAGMQTPEQQVAAKRLADLTEAQDKAPASAVVEPEPVAVKAAAPLDNSFEKGNKAMDEINQQMKDNEGRLPDADINEETLKKFGGRLSVPTVVAPKADPTKQPLLMQWVVGPVAKLIDQNLNNNRALPVSNNSPRRVRSEAELFPGRVTHPENELFPTKKSEEVALSAAEKANLPEVSIEDIEKAALPQERLAYLQNRDREANLAPKVDENPEAPIVKARVDIEKIFRTEIAPRLSDSTKKVTLFNALMGAGKSTFVALAAYLLNPKKTFISVEPAKGQLNTNYNDIQNKLKEMNIKLDIARIGDGEENDETVSSLDLEKALAAVKDKKFIMIDKKDAEHIFGLAARGNETAIQLRELFNGSTLYYGEFGQSLGLQIGDRQEGEDDGIEAAADAILKGPEKFITPEVANVEVEAQKKGQWVKTAKLPAEVIARYLKEQGVESVEALRGQKNGDEKIAGLVVLMEAVARMKSDELDVVLADKNKPGWQAVLVGRAGNANSDVVLNDPLPRLANVLVAKLMGRNAGLDDIDNMKGQLGQTKGATFIEQFDIIRWVTEHEGQVVAASGTVNNHVIRLAKSILGAEVVDEDKIQQEPVALAAKNIEIVGSGDVKAANGKEPGNADYQNHFEGVIADQISVLPYGGRALIFGLLRDGTKKVTTSWNLLMLNAARNVGAKLQKRLVYQDSTGVWWEYAPGALNTRPVARTKAKIDQLMLSNANDFFVLLPIGSSRGHTLVTKKHDEKTLLIDDGTGLDDINQSLFRSRGVTDDNGVTNAGDSINRRIIAIGREKKWIDEKELVTTANENTKLMDQQEYYQAIGQFIQHFASRYNRRISEDDRLPKEAREFLKQAIGEMSIRISVAIHQNMEGRVVPTEDDLNRMVKIVSEELSGLYAEGGELRRIMKNATSIYKGTAEEVKLKEQGVSELIAQIKAEVNPLVFDMVVKLAAGSDSRRTVSKYHFVGNLPGNKTVLGELTANEILEELPSDEVALKVDLDADKEKIMAVINAMAPKDETDKVKQQYVDVIWGALQHFRKISFVDALSLSDMVRAINTNVKKSDLPEFVSGLAPEQVLVVNSRKLKKDVNVLSRYNDRTHEPVLAANHSTEDQKVNVQGGTIVLKPGEVYVAKEGLVYAFDTKKDANVLRTEFVDDGTYSYDKKSPVAIIRRNDGKAERIDLTKGEGVLEDRTVTFGGRRVVLSNMVKIKDDGTKEIVDKIGEDVPELGLVKGDIVVQDAPMGDTRMMTAVGAFIVVLKGDDQKQVRTAFVAKADENIALPVKSAEGDIIYIDGETFEVQGKKVMILPAYRFSRDKDGIPAIEEVGIKALGLNALGLDMNTQDGRDTMVELTARFLNTLGRSDMDAWMYLTGDDHLDALHQQFETDANTGTVKPVDPTVMVPNAVGFLTGQLGITLDPKMIAQLETPVMTRYNELEAKEMRKPVAHQVVYHARLKAFIDEKEAAKKAAETPKADPLGTTSPAQSSAAPANPGQTPTPPTPPTPPTSGPTPGPAPATPPAPAPAPLPAPAPVVPPTPAPAPLPAAPSPLGSALPGVGGVMALFFGLNTGNAFAASGVGGGAAPVASVITFALIWKIVAVVAIVGAAFILIRALILSAVGDGGRTTDRSDSLSRGAVQEGKRD
ncbi:MAG: hypothetical protein HQL22_09215, partial [Candidatus Omnitrophica bacterium]|nr:hypothetical protein [Candidatus Omnitrophota bacterium]